LDARLPLGYSAFNGGLAFEHEGTKWLVYSEADASGTVTDHGLRKLGDPASKIPCVGEAKDKMCLIEQAVTPKLLEGR
jgi:hypothetical protein